MTEFSSLGELSI